MLGQKLRLDQEGQPIIITKLYLLLLFGGKGFTGLLRYREARYHSQVAGSLTKPSCSAVNMGVSPHSKPSSMLKAEPLSVQHRPPNRKYNITTVLNQGKKATTVGQQEQQAPPYDNAQQPPGFMPKVLQLESSWGCWDFVFVSTCSFLDIYASKNFRISWAPQASPASHNHWPACEYHTHGFTRMVVTGGFHGFVEDSVCNKTVISKKWIWLVQCVNYRFLDRSHTCLCVCSLFTRFQSKHFVETIAGEGKPWKQTYWWV